MSETRTKFTIDALGDRLRALAEGVEAEPKRMYWLTPDDTCADYCRPCAEACAAASGLDLDGGWETEEDSQAFCADCGVLLFCLFTDYGVRQEVESSAELDSIDPTSAWTLERIVTSNFPPYDPWRYYPDLEPALRAIWRLLP